MSVSNLNKIVDQLRIFTNSKKGDYARKLVVLLEKPIAENNKSDIITWVNIPNIDNKYLSNIFGNSFFIRFPSYKDYFNLINSGFNYFHERIHAKQRQKMRFDLDYKDDDGIDEKTKIFGFDLLISAIIKVFKSYNIDFIDEPENLINIIVTQGDKKQWSRHIIINNYYCETSRHCKELFKKIREVIDKYLTDNNKLNPYINNKKVDILDNGPYKDGTNFKMLGCAKPDSENPKMLKPVNFTLLDSFTDHGFEENYYIDYLTGTIIINDENEIKTRKIKFDDCCITNINGCELIDIEYIEKDNAGLNAYIQALTDKNFYSSVDLDRVFNILENLNHVIRLRDPYWFQLVQSLAISFGDSDEIKNRLVKFSMKYYKYNDLSEESRKTDIDNLFNQFTPQESEINKSNIWKIMNWLKKDYYHINPQHCNELLFFKKTAPNLSNYDAISNIEKYNNEYRDSDYLFSDFKTELTKYGLTKHFEDEENMLNFIIKNMAKCMAIYGAENNLIIKEDTDENLYTYKSIESVNNITFIGFIRVVNKDEIQIIKKKLTLKEFIINYQGVLKVYNSVACTPVKQKTDVFNTWNLPRGRLVDINDKNKYSDEIASKWKAFIFNVYCNKNTEVFKFVIQWLYRLFHQQEKKTGSLLFSWCKQGAGKTTMANLIMNVLGNKQSIKVNGIKHLLAEHNGWLLNKRFVLFEEIEGDYAGTRMAFQKIKDMVTSSRMSIRAMYQDTRDVPDYSNYMLPSNCKDACSIEISDRRTLAQELNDEYANDKPYFNYLYTDMNSQLTADTIFTMVYHLVDINDMPDGPITPPKTKLKTEIIKMCMNSVQKYLYDEYEKLSDEIKNCSLDELPDTDNFITLQDLYKGYSYYCSTVRLMPMALHKFKLEADSIIKEEENGSYRMITIRFHNFEENTRFNKNDKNEIIEIQPENMDIISRFIRDRVTKFNGSLVKKDELYEAFNNYVLEHGEKTDIKKNTLTKQLKAEPYNFEEDKKINWKNIKLLL